MKGSHFSDQRVPFEPAGIKPVAQDRVDAF
jgi:hypothetical protein